MFVPSHIASGYLLGRSLQQTRFREWTLSPFIPFLLLGTVLPDVDGVFSDTVAGHHSILHTPIFWVVLFWLLNMVGRKMNLTRLKPVALGILLGALSHLLTDWFTARTVGIQWLYPFSKADFYLFSIYPEKGQVHVWEMVINPYFSFYMENKLLFLFEIGVNLCAIGSSINYYFLKMRFK